MAWGSNIAGLPGVPEVSIYEGDRKFFAAQGEEDRKRRFNQAVADARAKTKEQFLAENTGKNRAELEARLAQARAELTALEQQKTDEDGSPVFPPAADPVAEPATPEPAAPVAEPVGQEQPVFTNGSSVPMPTGMVPNAAMAQQPGPQMPDMSGYPGQQGMAEAQMFGYREQPEQPEQPGSLAKKLAQKSMQGYRPTQPEQPVFGRRRF